MSSTEPIGADQVAPRPRRRGALPWRRLTGASATLVSTTAAINVLRIFNTVVLTRLLTPADYGLIGIVTSIFYVVAMLTDIGTQMFVVRHERGLDPDFLDTVWTVHLLRGLGNAVLAIAIAVPLGAALDKHAVAPLLMVAAISLAIDGAASLSLITALREKMVRKLSLIDLSAFLAQLVVGLLAALVLRNAWAVIIAIIVQSATRTAASYLLFPGAARRLRLDRDVAGELWRFSRTIAASSAVMLVISQIDRMVLARLFTLDEYGVYAIAGSLSSAPGVFVHLYSSRILYPALADVFRTSPERLRHAFTGARGLVFYGYLVAAGGLIGAAPLLIRLLYDPRYEAAGRFLQLLAIGTAMAMLTRPMQDLLVAVGKVRATLETNLVRLGWLIVGAVIGYLLVGPIGIVATLATIELPTYVFSAARLGRLGLYSLRHDLVAFALIGAGAVAGVLGSSAILAVVPIR